MCMYTSLSNTNNTTYLRALWVLKVSLCVLWMYCCRPTAAVVAPACALHRVASRQITCRLTSRSSLFIFLRLETCTMCSHGWAAWAPLHVWLSLRRDQQANIFICFSSACIADFPSTGSMVNIAAVCSLYCRGGLIHCNVRLTRTSLQRAWRISLDSQHMQLIRGAAWTTIHVVQARWWQRPLSSAPSSLHICRLYDDWR